MKKFYRFFILLALAAPAVIVSCGKDPGTEKPGGNTDDPGDNPSDPGTPGEATLINVKAGDDLQAAMDGAAVGAVVRVQGGVTFKGNFKMRDGVQMSGGWDAAFTKADPDDNKTVLDGNNAGRVLDQNKDFENLTVVTGFEIKNGAEENGAGVYIKKNGVVEKCYIHDNTATSGGGGIRINAGGICRNSEISQNTSNNNGGGAYVYGTLENCEVTFNKADNNCGGGAQLHDAGTISGCTFARNSASNGAGIRVYGNGGVIANCLIAANIKSDKGTGKLAGTGLTTNGNCTIINCTIVANQGSDEASTGNAPGLYIGNGGSDSSVYNCIVWGNKYNGGAVTGRQVKGTRVGLDNNAIAGGDETDPDVIVLSFDENGMEEAVNPMFVSVKNNVFRLKTGSPLVDKGLDDVVLAFPKDLDGEKRVSGTHVDLGCFELQQ